MVSRYSLLPSPPRGEGSKMALAPHLLDALLAGHGLARALAGAGVGTGALAAHRQAAAVAQAAVAADVAQAGDVLLLLAAELALDGVLAVEDDGEAGDLFLGQLAGFALRVHLGLAAHLEGRGRADAAD